MKVGFLNLGERRHGLVRYGRLLMAEAARRDGVDVVDAELALLGQARDDLPRLRDAAAHLSSADVVHVQYNRAIWGGGAFQLEALRTFLDSCTAPVVCTFHDVYPTNPWAEWKRKKTTRARIAAWWKDRRDRGPQNRAVRLLLRRAACSLVCFEEERRRLAAYPNAAEKLRVVGHFVESRGALPDRDAARAALGVEGSRVVTVLGYIHPRKGYDLAVEALPHLPPDVRLVFAGTAAEENLDKLKQLKKRAEKLGVAERLSVTGWLTDEEQERWLVATDLALCPFRFFSASGSLTTWLSAARPILVPALPQFDEYRAVRSDAFFTFSPYRAEALAEAVTASLAKVDGGEDPAIRALAEEFSLARTVDRHLEVYEAAKARVPAAS